LLESVAVTLVVEPAVCVPLFCIVADAVNVPLVNTDDTDVVKDGIDKSALEFIVINPQSAEHVPILTQTGCEPSFEGVTEKSNVFGCP
jgi:hypothetical protein